MDVRSRLQALLAERILVLEGPKGTAIQTLELSEELTIPSENILTPDYLRRICWRPPAEFTAESISGALAELGARPWQVEKMAPLLADAFSNPDPLEPKKPKHDDE